MLSNYSPLLLQPAYPFLLLPRLSQLRGGFVKTALFAIAVSLLLLFGCAGGSEGQSSAKQPSGAAPAGNAAPQAQGQASATASQQAQAQESEPSAPAETKNEESAVDKFASLLGMKKSIAFKADYTVKVSGETAGDSTKSGTGQYSMTTGMTQYTKGDKMRTDTESMGYSTRTYVLSEKVYLCTNADTGWVCMEFPQGEEASQQAVSELESNPEEYSPVADGTMNVAGTAASCYRLDNVQGFKVKYCFSSEGVPLYVKTEGTAEGKAFQSETVAKSYSLSVSDSDFSLPAEPQGFGMILPPG